MIIFIVGKLMDLPRVLIINWVFWKIEPRKHIVTIYPRHCTKCLLLAWSPFTKTDLWVPLPSPILQIRKLRGEEVEEVG